MFPHQGFGIRDRNQKSLIGNLKSTRYDRAPFGVPLETRAGAQFYSKVSGLFPSSMSRIAAAKEGNFQSLLKEFHQATIQNKSIFQLFQNISKFFPVFEGRETNFAAQPGFHKFRTTKQRIRLLALEVQFWTKLIPRHPMKMSPDWDLALLDRGLERGEVSGKGPAVEYPP